MNNNKIKMMNKLGKVVELPVGYSLTTALFGIFPSIYRLDLKSTLLIFAANYLLIVIFETIYVDYSIQLGLTLLLAAGLGYFRNNWLFETYIRKGYTCIKGQDMTKEELDIQLGFESQDSLWK